MGIGLIAALSGQSVPGMSAPQRRRLRIYLSELRGATDPDRVLSAWIPQRPPLQLSVAPSDLDDLGRDARITRTGFSDPRARVAAAGQLEVRVAEADLNDLQREYLLRPSDRPNVFVHVDDRASSAPVPLGLLLVDLAHHPGVRERSRVADLLKEMSP
ncbi:hypothetical protein [Subtercola sp. Z020]|uniref:hypothetical protein n=1 Tax=Subtercola sp. Z020 TaxID=2080582 RepID=UPI0011B02F45|nr:hypothetical protein [Subtercola sp. Z020]